MCLQEERWLAEEDQWRTRSRVHGWRGGDAFLPLLYDHPGGTGGGEGGRQCTTVVAEAETKGEVGANSEEVK